jgi:hypothetical protein
MIGGVCGAGEHKEDKDIISLWKYTWNMSGGAEGSTLNVHKHETYIT